MCEEDELSVDVKDDSKNCDKFEKTWDILM
jgi:hypothetical protein